MLRHYLLVSRYNMKNIPKNSITAVYEQQVQRTVSSPIPTVNEYNTKVSKTPNITDKYINQVAKIANSPIPKATQAERDKLELEVSKVENNDDKECYKFSNLKDSTVFDVIKCLELKKEVHTLDLSENFTLSDRGLEQLTKFLADENFSFQKLIITNTLYSDKCVAKLIHAVKNRSDKPEIITDRITVTLNNDNYMTLLDDIIQNKDLYFYVKYINFNVTISPVQLYCNLLHLAQTNHNILDVKFSEESKRASYSSHYMARIEGVLENRRFSNFIYDVFTSPWTYTVLASGIGISAIAVYNPPAAAVIVGAAAVCKLTYEGYKYCTSKKQISEEAIALS